MNKILHFTKWNLNSSTLVASPFMLYLYQSVCHCLTFLVYSIEHFLKVSTKIHALSLYDHALH